MKSKQVKNDLRSWEVARIRIYYSNIQIGCGGLHGDAVNEALPVISDFIELLNSIRTLAGYQGEACKLEHNGGTYLPIINLEDFSTQAGWLFAGTLYKNGWEFQEIHDNTASVKNSRDPHFQDYAEFFRIDMIKFNK